MRNSATLGPWLRRFLLEHLVSERNLSRNTQFGYRDAFALLVPRLAQQAGKVPERLDVHDLSVERVLAFLAHLAEQRGCSPQTCNQRLAAIRSFARFVGSRDPTHLEWSGQIRAISPKKIVGFVTTWPFFTMLPDALSIGGGIAVSSPVV